MTAAAQRKRSRPNRVRLEDFLALEDAHPYGCLPGGNRFFRSAAEADDEKISSCSPAGTKESEWLPDSVWQSVLEFCDASTLSRVVQASRYLYVAGHQPELWRDMVLRRCGEEHRSIDRITDENDGEDGRTMKSWRDTYLFLFVKNPSLFRPHKPMRIPGVYSDEYYRTHRCRSFAIPDAWLDPEISAAEDNFPTIAIGSITPESFLQDFELTNTPVVIKGAAQSTRALLNWQDPTYLQRHNIYGKTFRTTSGAAPLSINFSLDAYKSYSQFDYLEESPLYLFDRTALDNPHWQQDFFPEFYQKCPWWDPSAKKYSHDLLQHLGAEERPDHTWLIMGPKRSGSVFHIDPNATHAWNACIQGRKRWIFYPPGCPPPGVFPSEDGDEVAIPFSVGEWLLQHWSEHLQRYKRSQDERPMECTVFPGDVVFVPHGWWHMVINLDDQNCAITHNYVSPSNLGNVLKFFIEKQDQVSGCRDRVETIKPEHLHDALVQALTKVEPNNLQMAQQQQGWTCRAWKEESEATRNKQKYTDHDKKKNKHRRTEEPQLTKDAGGGTSVMDRTEKVAAFSFSFL